jgi:hypothetical protein
VRRVLEGAEFQASRLRQALQNHSDTEPGSSHNCGDI